MRKETVLTGAKDDVHDEGLCFQASPPARDEEHIAWVQRGDARHEVVHQRLELLGLLRVRKPEISQKKHVQKYVNK